MKQPIKTYKCDRCKNIFPTLKFDQFKQRLIDNKKYINRKLVCERCYNSIKESNRLNGS